MAGSSAARPVCILSVGRSGTSLAARTVNLLGVDLGPQQGMLAANDWNPHGFWEQQAIMELNDEILSALGGTYWHPPERTPGWELDPRMEGLRRRAAELVAEHFEPGRRWGFKDPRTAFTLPLWRTVFGDMDFVLCVRDPAEVVASLHARNPSEDADHLLWLWLHANCESIRQTVGSRRIVVFYDEWFRRPEATLERIAGFLGCDVTDAVRDDFRTFFDPSLHRERAAAGFDPPEEAALLAVLLRLLSLPEGDGDPSRATAERLAASRDTAFADRARQVLAAAAQRERMEAVALELERQRALLAALQGSLSWRLTAPLRAAKRRLTRG